LYVGHFQNFLLSKLLRSNYCYVKYSVLDEVINVNIKLQNIYKVMKYGKNPPCLETLKVLLHRSVQCWQKSSQKMKANLRTPFSYSFRRLMTQFVTKAYYGNLKTMA